MTEDTPKKKRRWRYMIDLGPLSLFVWITCIFFFITWIFVLGIFVGRGFMPEKISDLSGIQGEISKLHDTLESTETRETKKPVSSSVSEKEPELAFYDKLTTKKEEARVNIPSGSTYEESKSSPVTVPLKETAAVQQPISENKTPAQAVAIPVNDKMAQTPTAAVPANDKKAPGQTVAATANAKKTVAPPAVSASKTGAGKYTIQLAAIAERAKAEKTVKQLIEKGFDAYYYETKVKNKTYYRIRCGKFADRAEAVKTALKLQEKAGLKGYVTGAE
jgi:cell division septation protein DedD